MYEAGSFAECRAEGEGDEMREDGVVRMEGMGEAELLTLLYDI